MSRLRVVIAEDHYLMREGLRELLEGTGAVEVVAAVDRAPELLAVVDDAGPDAVLTDIRMPPGHSTEGIQAARQIRARHPEVGVVVLSQYADPLYALDLFRDGTAGLAYLLKDRIGEVDELLRALREVRSGGSVIDPKVVERLLARGARQPQGGVALTPREREVLAEMANGRSNAGVARALVLSQSAVEKHVNSIFSKLGLTEAEDTHRRVAPSWRISVAWPITLPTGRAAREGYGEAPPSTRATGKAAAGLPVAPECCHSIVHVGELPI